MMPTQKSGVSPLSEVDRLIAEQPERRGLWKHYPLKRMNQQRLEEHSAAMRRSNLHRVQGRRRQIV